MGESFLQSAGKKTLLIQAAQKTQAVDDYQRDELLSLLQGKNPFGAYSGQSGEIVGMLKAMKDEMAGDLKSTVAAEEQAAAGFEELAAAKKQEIAAPRRPSSRRLSAAASSRLPLRRPLTTL